ncbi:ultraviolet-B receptor UVR8, partial [Tanacetum coccineum]
MEEIVTADSESIIRQVILISAGASHSAALL